MPECNGVDILAVTTTVGSLEEARCLARGVVQARLAACVQLEPITASVYRWEGRLREEPEVRLTFKTTRAQAAALQAFFVEHHPYDVPQFVALPCQASAAYGKWVLGETG